MHTCDNTNLNVHLVQSYVYINATMKLNSPVVEFHQCRRGNGHISFNDRAQNLPPYTI